MKIQVTKTLFAMCNALTNQIDPMDGDTFILAGIDSDNKDKKSCIITAAGQITDLLPLCGAITHSFVVSMKKSGIPPEKIVTSLCNIFAVSIKELLESEDISIEELEEMILDNSNENYEADND